MTKKSRKIFNSLNFLQLRNELLSRFEKLAQLQNLKSVCWLFINKNNQYPNSTEIRVNFGEIRKIQWKSEEIQWNSVEIHESRDLWSPKISSCFPLGFLWLKILVYLLFCFNIFVNSFSDTWVWQYFQRNVGHEILVLIFPISSISPILTAE